VNGKKILIISGDAPPGLGLPSVGIGIRAWTLCEGLQHHGFDAVLSLPECVLAKTPVASPMHEHAHDFYHCEVIIDKVKPDVIIVEQRYVPPALELTEIPVVLDLPGPHLLEKLVGGEDNLLELVATKLFAFAVADYYLCDNRRQLDYYLPWYLLAGGNEYPPPFAIVPISFSPDLPMVQEKSATDPLHVLYAGYHYPWQDNEQYLSALMDGARRLPQMKLTIITGRHPTTDLGTAPSFLSYGVDNDAIEVLPPQTFAALTDKFREADIAFDLAPPSSERRLCSSIRMVHQLWAGLPVVVGRDVPLAAEIDRKGLGFVTDSGSDMALLKKLVEQKKELREKRTLVQEWVRQHRTWDKTMLPLVAYCNNPIKRPGKRNVLSALPELTQEVKLELTAKKYELDKLHECIETINQQLIKKNKQLTETTGRLTETTGRLTETTGRLTETTGRLTETTGRLTETTEQLVGAKTERDHWQYQCDVLMREKKELAGDLKRIQDHWLLRLRRFLKEKFF